MTVLMNVPDDTRALRNAFACYPSGVTAVCAIVDGVPTGMAASSFTTVSLEPPLVSVCIQNSSTTWQRLKEAQRIGVSVLSENQDLACVKLASKTGDRFEGLDWSAEETGAVFIEGSTAQLDCSIYGSFDAGDHAIVLLRVHALGTTPDVQPLVFHGSRMRRLSPIAP
ncbi:flavin reductase family protein [Rhizobium sp. SL86]|uniref:flavin reductase family protein n=1 Tax=Rhizobium sp. SL86 TaxID=2995148 RepID=UPI0022723133|nr:flavin reductase family protein [Rhizobium sp. SL86]MCY1667812.1 flavin reductase family protein [Rhizobium sp. SL86]